MKLSAKNARDGVLLVLPVVLGCLIFYALPFILVIRYSVTQGVGSSARFVGAENYLTMWQNELFRKAFRNTARFLLLGLPLILVISYAIALLLKNEVEKHKLLKSVLLFPYIMPVIGAVLVVNLVFGKVGLLNRCLMALGAPVRDWLHSPASFWVAMALYIWKNTGYSVILLLSGLMTIPADQYAAAQLDGAGRFRQFWHITVPQMWYSVFFATVFSLINAFKCFREIFLIGGAHPDDSVYMLQHFINNCFENLNYPKLAVASVLLSVSVTAVLSVMFIWVRRKERYRE